jgi:hypothetical protein
MSVVRDCIVIELWQDVRVDRGSCETNQFDEGNRFFLSVDLRPSRTQSERFEIDFN